MLRWWIVGLLLVGAGCSRAGAGESTPLLCSNGMDDDGDHLEDCADPGCQALEECARGPVPVVPAAPALIGNDGLTLPLPPGAISVPESDAGAVVDDLDAGDLPEPPPADAGVIEEEPLPCGGRCTATQACLDEECQDVTSPTTGRYELRIVSAMSPTRTRELLDPCLDNDCLAPPFACTCAPDPFVRVLLVRESSERMEEGVEIGRTSTVVDRTRVTFMDPAFEFVLEPGDALRFEIWDADQRSATFAFGCSPDLRDLAPGRIGCTGSVQFQAASIVAELTEVKP